MYLLPLLAVGLVLAPPLLLGLARRNWLPVWVATITLAVAATAWTLVTAGIPALKQLDQAYLELQEDHRVSDTQQQQLLHRSERWLARNCPSRRSLALACSRLHSLYADLLTNRGEYRLAAQEYALMRRADDSEINRGDAEQLALRHATALFLLARQDDNNGKAASEAHQVALEALALNPTHPQTLQLLAALAEMAGDYQEAIVFLERAVIAVKESGTSLQLMAEIGRVRQLLHPELAAYRLHLSLNPQQQPPPGGTLVLRAYLKKIPQIPVAEYKKNSPLWPLLLVLGAQHAPLAGFDLATAHSRGDDIKLVAEYTPNDTSPVWRGHLALPAASFADTTPTHPLKMPLSLVIEK